MMKLYMLVIFLIGTIADGEEYETKYDNIDIDEVLNNYRLLTSYIKCLMGEGPCTPDGSTLKNNLPDAIETDCAKCSEKQRIGANKVMRYLIDNRPDDWARIETIYDTEGIYRIAYMKAKGDAVANTTTSISTDNNSAKKVTVSR